LQDWVLARLRPLAHGFYLTGGTALARGYYHHRDSEHLDFFVNDAPEFELWRDRCLHELQQQAAGEHLRCEILLREDRFGRAVLQGAVFLKLEFVNDVPFRVGQPWEHPALGRLDTKENILANKVSALVDRQEPKDLADIYWLCCLDGLSVSKAIENAAGKAAGLFPPMVAKVLDEGAQLGVPRVFWKQAPDEHAFRRGIEKVIGELLG
jgi:hypothetical protein